MSVNVTFKEPEKHGLLFTLYMIGMVLAGAIVNAPGAIWYLMKRETTSIGEAISSIPPEDSENWLE